MFNTGAQPHLLNVIIAVIRFNVEFLLLGFKWLPIFLALFLPPLNGLNVFVIPVQFFAWAHWFCFPPQAEIPVVSL